MMDLIETYIKWKNRYDEATKTLSVYVFGDKYRKQRIIIHVVFILSVLVITWRYSESTGNYQLFKLITIAAVVDSLGVIRSIFMSIFKNK